MTASLHSSLKNLVRVSDGYAHQISHVRFRITSSDVAPVAAALKTWDNLDPMSQEFIAQCDEIWRVHEKSLKQARTGLEAYVRFQTIPSCAVQYKDLCGNTAAHRLIFTFRKAHPDLVREFWDFAEHTPSLVPMFTQKNAFSHSPWEMMTLALNAWTSVLDTRVHELHRLVPLRSWRDGAPFRTAYFSLPEDYRAVMLAKFAPRQVGLLCALTTPEGFEHMVRASPEFLNFLQQSMCIAYPMHAAVALKVALECSNDETICRLVALVT